MKTIILQQPSRIIFGEGAADTFVDEFIASSHRRLFLLTTPPIVPLIDGLVKRIEQSGVEVHLVDSITAEPTLDQAESLVRDARSFDADSVVGIGGGSVLDVAKVVAAFAPSDQSIADCFGTGLVGKRGLWLACLPTTSGTGSEVSPNAILLDQNERLKKGIVSPYLLADTACIDPLLTLTVPKRVTAETGIDALTHCIEAYTNRFAHPAVDIYALQGISLIAANLRRAVADGSDRVARTALSLGSYYGGLCLAPVNTAAVHALSYPLGGEYHLSHGLANAVLLPSVMRFNMPVCIDRYATVARAVGVDCAGLTKEESAQRAVEAVAALTRDCGIPATLSEIGICQSDVPGLARSAMKVTRLLVNNPREVTEQDACDIYNTLFR